MKKTTLLLFALCLTFDITYSQETISFEAGEGYALGDINTQNGWEITGCGPSCFIDNQDVSDEMSTNGSYSFKIDLDGSFGTQTNPIMGGFYTYGAPIPYTTAVFSADMYISTAGSSNFRFGIANITAGSFVAIFEFDYTGTVYVLDDIGAGIEGVDILFSWSPMTWYNVRMEISGTTITYFVDDVQVYQGVIAYSGDIEEARFVHDNWDGYAYIDNFKTNDENLSIHDDKLNQIKIVALNKSIGLYNLPSSASYNLYIISGQEVLKGSTNQRDHVIEASSLASGVYIVELGDTNTNAVIRKKVVLQ
jgi:hypothetical protein